MNKIELLAPAGNFEVIALFENVTKEFIRTHEFQAEVPTVELPAQSFRLMSARNLPPTDTELQIELRKKFIEIMATTFDKSYAKIESRFT